MEKMYTPVNHILLHVYKSGVQWGYTVYGHVFLLQSYRYTV